MIPFTFLPGKGKLIAAGLAAAAFVGLALWGLYWRGEYRSAQVEIVALRAQERVLGAAVEACSESVAHAALVGEEALQTGHNLLAEARRLSSGGRAVVNQTEALIAEARALVAAGKPPVRPDGTPKDCGDAWREIQKIENEKAMAGGSR